MSCWIGRAGDAIHRWVPTNHMGATIYWQATNMDSRRGCSATPPAAVKAASSNSVGAGRLPPGPPSLDGGMGCATASCYRCLPRRYVALRGDEDPEEDDAHDEEASSAWQHSRARPAWRSTWHFPDRYLD